MSAKLKPMRIGWWADVRFAPVIEVFAEVADAQPGTGAALSVCCEGRLVLDLYGGYADAARTELLGPYHLVQPYSVTKPFAAACALRLVDDGALDLDEPVQRYWPDFTAAATVRHVLSHQAGVVALDEAAPTETFYDWDDLCARLAAQEPEWEPGSAHGESALFYGHLVGELVRRVDGRSLGTFLAEEICGPLDLDFHIGLGPAELARTVDLTGLDDAFRRANAEGRPELYQRAVSNPPGAQDGEVVNSTAWRAAEVPAVNGHGTAQAVAAFYKHVVDGEVLSRELLEEATTAQSEGPDLVFGAENAWGLGFAVDGDGFGMGGLGGSYGGHSRTGGYSLAFMTGSVGTHERGLLLENAVRDCLGLPHLE